MCLFNIGSWNGHLEHFLSDNVYSRIIIVIENNYSSLFCFTEANIIDSPAKHTDKIPDIWKDIHKNNMLRREYGKLH